MKSIYYMERPKGAPKNILNGAVLLLILLFLFLGIGGLINFFQSIVNIWNKYSSYFLNGLLYTILLSLISLFFGVILGIIIYFMRVSKSRIISELAKGIVELLMGTPLMVQLFITFFGASAVFDVRSLGIPIGKMAFIAGSVAVSVNSGAYVSEIIRSGIQSVSKGQMEAGRSLGMSYSDTMREIIMPQAIKNILPALGNEFITLIKETSIVSVIGVADIMYNVNIVRGASFKPMEPLIIAAMLYFILTFGLSKLLGIFERRLKESD